MIYTDDKGNSYGMFLSMEEIEKYKKNYKVGNRGGANMSRYEKVEEKTKADMMNELYNGFGNFFMKIEIRNFKAHIECCGDMACGIPAMFYEMFSITKKTGMNNSKEFLHEILDKCWEEEYGNKSDSN